MTAKRAIFTIVTKAYLAQARAMAKDLGVTHPELPLYVFLADRPDGCLVPEDEPFKIVPVEEILPPDLLPTMTGYYTAYELCNALKPFAHLHMSAIKGIDQWLYLDSDIHITGSLEPIWGQLADASILLIPHILRAGAATHVETQEINFLRVGIYNGGCLGVRKSTQASLFLEWWQERLVWYCLHDSPGLEADQSWLNFVPSLFPDSKIFDKPGVNVAHFNIHERPLRSTGDGILSVLGEPVAFVHFSGWDWRQPEVPTKHGQLDLGESKAAWQQAAGDYAQLLQACGVEACSQWPYSFALAKDGRMLTPAMRRNYRTYLLARSGKSDSVSIFDHPEMFADPVPPPPVKCKPLSLWGATRMWLGTLKRCLLPR